MGRLQYLNRKIDGEKLGAVVAKDLRKRIPPGSGAKAAQRDPQVELDVSHKALNDAAAAEICGALIESIRNEVQATKLEELKLRDNRLTARTLKAVAQVVLAAAADLQDIDLSTNDIRIVTDDDAGAWEQFLRALAKCFVLRRLDLSKNPLGTRAFEILYKVYQREDSELQIYVVDDTATLGRSRGESNPLAEQCQNLSLGEEQHSASASVQKPVAPNERQDVQTTPEKPHAHRLPADLMTHFSSTCGIRSIPYILFNECDLTDACAMYLSYVVELHLSAEELLSKVPTPKPGEPARQLEAYDAVDGCDGIIWKPNKTLSLWGTKVLELAERARNGATTDDFEQFEEAIESSSPGHNRRVSDASASNIPIGFRHRRDSVLASQGTSSLVRPVIKRRNELHSTRSKIQGDMLCASGPQCNKLWIAAVQMLALARPLLVSPKVIEEPEIETEADPIEPQPTEEAPAELEMEKENSPPQPVLSEEVWPRLAKPLQPISQNASVVLRLNTNKRGVAVLEPERPPIKVPETLPEKAPEEKVEVTPKPKPDVPKVRRKVAEKPYRSSLPKGLDEYAWGRILAYAIGTDEIVSWPQQAQIVRYASRRHTLEDEMERLGKQTGQQIWKALDGMACLEYA